MAEDLGVITSDVVALRWVGGYFLQWVLAVSGCLWADVAVCYQATNQQNNPTQTQTKTENGRETIGAPGMVVLQFAWGGGPFNVHLPHMHYENSFCYPGTHDNETSVGWYKGSANATDKVGEIMATAPGGALAAARPCLAPPLIGPLSLLSWRLLWRPGRAPDSPPPPTSSPPSPL
jgi:hypothetical protein